MLDALPVWTISPDWSDGITETLEWLTGLLASPIGAEQRFGLRLTPRRSFEMTFKPVDWRSFARAYNGPGQVDVYAAKLSEAYQGFSS